MSKGIIISKETMLSSHTFPYMTGMPMTLVDDTLYILDSDYKIYKLIPRNDNLTSSSWDTLDKIYVADNPRKMMGENGYRTIVEWDYKTHSAVNPMQEEVSRIEYFYYSNGMFYIVYDYLQLKINNSVSSYYTYAKSKDLITWEKISYYTIDSKSRTTDYHDIYDDDEEFVINTNNIINVFYNEKLQWKFKYINDNMIIFGSYVGNNHNVFSWDNEISIGGGTEPSLDYNKYVLYNEKLYFVNYSGYLYCKNGDNISQISMDKKNDGKSGYDYKICISNGKLYYTSNFGTFILNDDGISSTQISTKCYWEDSSFYIYDRDCIVDNDGHSESEHIIYKDSSGIVRRIDKTYFRNNKKILSIMPIKSLITPNNSKLIKKNELGVNVNHKDIFFNGKHHREAYLGSELIWSKDNQEHVGFKFVEDYSNQLLSTNNLIPFGSENNYIIKKHVSFSYDSIVCKNDTTINRYNLRNNVYNNLSIYDSLSSKISSIDYYEYKNGILTNHTKLNIGDSYSNGMIYEPQYSFYYSNGDVFVIYVYAISCIILDDNSRHFQMFHQASVLGSNGALWLQVVPSYEQNSSSYTMVFPSSIESNSLIIPNILDINNVETIKPYYYSINQISYGGLSTQAKEKSVETKYMTNLPLSDGKYLYYYYNSEDKIYCVDYDNPSNNELIDNVNNITKFFGMPNKVYGISDQDEKKEIYRIKNKVFQKIGFTSKDMVLPIAIVGDKYMIGQYVDGKYGIWYLPSGECRWDTIANELSSEVNEFLNSETNHLLSVVVEGTTFALVFPEHTLYFKY